MLPIQSASVVREMLLQGGAQGMPASGAGDVLGGLWQAASQGIQATNTKAQQAVTGLLSGTGVEVHDAMIATQQADLQLELALQVRNKAVAAYQQMMSMQF